MNPRRLATVFSLTSAANGRGRPGRAESAGVRVVFVRIGFVLGQGGALKLIRPVFKLGLGGKLGSGRQWMSGVHVDDVAGMIVWALENETVNGPVNAVMPAPFRNSEFTEELARSRPASRHLARPGLCLAPGARRAFPRHA